jgi:hypothetical protein
MPLTTDEKLLALSRETSIRHHIILVLCRSPPPREAWLIRMAAGPGVG